MSFLNASKMMIKKSPKREVSSLDVPGAPGSPAPGSKVPPSLAISAPWGFGLVLFVFELHLSRLSQPRCDKGIISRFSATSCSLCPSPPLLCLLNPSNHGAPLFYHDARQSTCPERRRRTAPT